MLIGIATLLLLMFTLSGSESAFIDPDAKKNVKKYVIEKESQAEILSLMKSFEKEFKAGRKKEIKQEKALEKLLAVRGSSQEDFQSVFDEYMQSRKSRQETYIKSVLKAKSIITDSEWENILTGIDKKKDKQSKEWEKMVSDVEKANAKIKSQLKNQINDEERRSRASQIIEEVNVSEVAILRKLNEYNYKDNNLLRNRNATEEEYRQTFKEYNDLWQEHFNLYTSAYEQLSAVTTDEEWKVIKKLGAKVF